MDRLAAPSSGDHRALFRSSVRELEAGQLEAALDSVSRALGLSPANPLYLCNRGLIEYRLGRLDDAANDLYQAARLKPDLVEASFNLGLVLEDAGKPEAALLCFERACDLAPERFPAQYRFARALRLATELARSIGHYQCALALCPGITDVELELALVFKSLRRFEAAETLLRKTLAREPESALAHADLGDVLLEARRIDDAVLALRAAIALEPAHGTAHFRLGNALKERAEVEAALASFRTNIELNPDDHLAHSNLVYLCSFHSGHDAGAVLRQGLDWAERHAQPARQWQRPHDNDRTPGRRLRLGYLSPDFRDHCQSLFTLPVFAHHDRAAFEVYAYSLVERLDGISARVEASVDVFRHVRKLDDAALCQTIRDDRIDVLIDLTQHMADNRLPVYARKPAPVQICWLAYPGTTGLCEIDYRVTDRHLDPPGTNLELYAERSLVLPDCYWCYDPLARDPEPGPLPARENGFVTFGCFNTFCKVSADSLALWASALRALPSARLVLSAPLGSARERVSAEFRAAGVDPSRLRFTGFVPRDEYLARYRDVDLCLDTVPYNGHTTSLDAFWMGAPVITLVGNTLVGRAGLCLANNLGLPELVAHTPEEFTRIARTLGTDLARLSRLRAELRARMEASPLMNAPRFTRNLEAAYRRAFGNWCDGIHRHETLE